MEPRVQRLTRHLEQTGGAALVAVRALDRGQEFAPLGTVIGSTACMSSAARSPHQAERAPTIGIALGSALSFFLSFTPAMSAACQALIIPTFRYLRPARSRACHRIVLP